MGAKMKAMVAAAVLASAGGFAAGANAATVVQIASYTQVGGGKTFAWDGVGGNGGRLFTNSTLAANASAAQIGAASAQWVNVIFNFNDAGVMGLQGQLLFNATAPTGAATQLTNTNPIRQSGLNGSFAFKYTGGSPVTAYGTTFNTGANLLSGTFTNGWLSVGGSSGGFADSYGLTGGTVTLTSSVIPMNKLIDGDLGFSFSGLTPQAAIIGANGTRQLRDFRASAGANFSATAVPEPTTWALMIMGFGAAGAILRRRAAAVAA
ncbi:PEPxxWA-CTERM sorting domain-containing protein [Phenylobacterium sp.]|uniref:PEPxxWA-CTERM sorting domain-containing protein n=1 Tax=Phenylobacterium sp. TaxID=1871053 RepID=UPI00120BA16E|nr:PEPxxWA-CTERM sorting domain-containing protein [Phenylobacterium sp.]TAL28794.1 MAG: PEP-CTERM sorting domain-containing protein [Phenylobacterium sp.]